MSLRTLKANVKKLLPFYKFEKHSESIAKTVNLYNVKLLYLIPDD